MFTKLIRTNRKTDFLGDLGQDGVISPLTKKKARQFIHTGTLVRKKRHNEEMHSACSKKSSELSSILQVMKQANHQVYIGRRCTNINSNMSQFSNKELRSKTSVTLVHISCLTNCLYFKPALLEV